MENNLENKNQKWILVKVLVGERTAALKKEIEALRFDYDTRLKIFYEGTKFLMLAQDHIDKLQHEYDLLKSQIEITIK